MNRRAFLATGGIALGAGCSSLVGDNSSKQKQKQSKPPAKCAIDPSVTPGKPGWPSETGGTRNTRSVPAANVPSPPLELDWTFKTSGRVAAPRPVIVDGTVYATNYDDEIHAVDAETGKHRWQVNIPVNSRIAVAGNRLFVVSDKALHALDTETGESVWATEPTPDPSILSSGMQVAEETVFVFGSLYLVAFDAKTGKQRWRFTTGLETEGSPAVTDGVAYVGSNDTYVYALDAKTGERKWRYKTGDQVSCNPVVTDGVVYAASEDGHLYTFDAKTGKNHWKRQVENVEALAVDGGHVYTGMDFRAENDTLRAFTAESGTPCWSSSQTELGYTGSFAASSRYLYLPTWLSGTNGEQTFGALKPGTGQRVWRDTKSGVTFDGGLAVADGAVYAGVRDEDNELAVARFVSKH